MKKTYISSTMVLFGVLATTTTNMVHAQEDTATDANANAEALETDVTSDAETAVTSDATIPATDVTGQKKGGCIRKTHKKIDKDPIPATATDVTSDATIPAIDVTGQKKVVVGYYVNWAIYARNHNVSNLDASSITHLNYAFANITDGIVVLTDTWADEQKPFTEIQNFTKFNESDVNVLRGSLGALHALKMNNRHLHTGISIGGWTLSKYFSDIAALPDSRKKFVNSSIALIETYGFDYIDLDWEYPVDGKGQADNIRRPEDKDNFILLLKEFKVQIDTKYSDNADNNRLKPYVTIALPCFPLLKEQLDVEKIAELVEFINVMCYDFASSISAKSGHNANLFNVIGSDGLTTSTHSVDQGLQSYLNNGVPSSKLVMGVPFYARSFANTEDGPGNLFVGVGAKRDVDFEEGVHDYKTMPFKNADEKVDTQAVAATSYDLSTKTWASYDNPETMQLKMEYILKNNLRGAMFWESSGDFPGTESRSLINVMRDMLLTGSHNGKNNNIYFPDSKFINLKDVELQENTEGMAQ